MKVMSEGVTFLNLLENDRHIFGALKGIFAIWNEGWKLTMLTWIACQSELLY